jgi:hypothetical protein
MWQYVTRPARFIWHRLGDLALIHDIAKGWQALVVAVPTLSAFVGSLVQSKPFGEIVFWTMATFFVSVTIARIFIGNWGSESFSWKKREPQPQYLPDRDEELGLAIYLMALRSAWGRWFSAQHLSMTGKPIEEKYLMMMASVLVVDKARDGALEIHGRPKDGIDYKSIPREHWRLIGLDVTPDARRIWTISIIPCSDVKPKRISELLRYDSLVIDSRQFEKLWPLREPATDAARLKLLEQAKTSGVHHLLIEKLL